MNDDISALRAEIADLKRHVLELKALLQAQWPKMLVRPGDAEAPPPTPFKATHIGLVDAYTPALDAWKE